MIVLIRTEASQEIGFGHLVRCLSIAKKIRDIGSRLRIVFLIPDNAQTVSKLTDNSYEYCLINDKNEEKLLIDAQENFHPDVIFIDKLFNYSITFINTLRQKSKVVMLHNYCDGAYVCDSYIFPSAHTDPSLLNDERWQTSNTYVFDGFDYVVLNEDVLKIRRYKENPALIKKVVITTGGSDPVGVMIMLIDWLNDESLENMEIWALIGEAFYHRDTLLKISKNLNPQIHLVDYHPEIFLDSDLAISTFGVSTYEILYLSIPVMSIGHCRQNAHGSRILSEKCDMLTDVGYINELSKETFFNAFNKILDNSMKMIDWQLIDGRGAERIAEIIIKTGKGEM